MKPRLLCHPNARLAILPVRCLGKTSTIDPDSSADKSRNAKSTGQRSDDLFESLFELGRSAENFAGSAETQSAPIAAREPFSESTRFAASARPNYRTDSRPHYARERESTPRPAFAPISAKPTDEELQQHLNRSVQSTGGLKSFNHLLDSIKPALKELEPHQFAVVFEKLHEQIGFLKRHKNIGLYWSAQTLRESASFAALLNQTNSLIDDLSTDDLAVLFKLLRSISHDPESAIVKSIVQLIDKRLDEVDLDLLSRFLLRTNLYLRKFPTTGHLVRLRANLLENCRRRILNNELNAENFDQLSALFYNFLESCQNEDAFEMVEQLTQTILSDCDLDFNKAVLIASDILTALRGTLAGQNRYPHQLTELIDRCNSTIIESLESNPDATGDHYFFLDMVHRNRSRIYVQFRDFFSPKLLDLMGSFLAREHEANRKIRDPVSVLNLVHNYANVNVFNQKLIELVCSLITSGEYPRDRLSSSDYFMLSEHRWPFVDQQRLLSVFKSSDRFLQNLKNRNRDQGLFCDLILSEVNDPGLLNYLNQALSSRKEAPSIKSSTMRFYNYERVALARLRLSMFAQLADQELQRKSDERLISSSISFA